MGGDLDYKFFFFQAEDGIRDLVRSRGLGDVYKRQREGRGDDRRAPECVLHGCVSFCMGWWIRDRVIRWLSLIHI